MPTSIASPSPLRSESAVVARDLCKSFGRIQATNRINLEVPRGSCFGLIGANGAGKTTFIKLMLGIARPSSGDVVVLGGTPEDNAIRRRIGYLPERLQLPPAFTPIDFLRSVGKTRGLPSGQIEKAIVDTLRDVGLEESAWRRAIGPFSKGMKQRTGLAAALLGNPDLLILDEPTDGIDPMGRSQIRDVIHRAHQRGATVFLNSHLLSETEKICDHVAILHQGHVAQAGSIDALRAQNSYFIRFQGPSKEITQAIYDENIDRLRKELSIRMKLVDNPRNSSDDTVCFHIENQDAVAVSRLLPSFVQAGFVIEEMHPAMRDLESILREAVSSEQNSVLSSPVGGAV